MLTIVTANVNGIRAALRRGMGEWLAGRRPDVLCLQEVRAPGAALQEAFGPGWHAVHEEAAAKGRAGVAVMSRTPKGEAGTPKQEEKHRFLTAFRARTAQLAADGRHVLVCGVVKIAHCQADLKNWKGNVGNAGFLPAERAWFDRLLGEDGAVDGHRALTGEGPGPSTWWSWRGKAFDIASRRATICTTAGQSRSRGVCAPC